MNAGRAADAIAQAFVDARQSGAGLADYPGTQPQSLDEAYAIQERAIRLFGGRIAGWKVGRIPDPLVERYGVNRLAGPIFAGSVVEAPGGEIPEMPIFTDGFGAAEAEYLLRLGSLPDRFDRAWTNEEAARFVDDIRIGIEVASSPFQGINEHGPAVTISDFGNNNGLVIGAPIDPGADFADWPVSLTIDGAVAGAATARAMLDGPFGAVRFLFELAAARGLPLASGQWVSTGAVTGVHQVRPGAAIEAKFGDTMRVQCSIGGKRQG
ncbi:2-keto-4-pentenoate hydratase [Sphingomonas sp. MMS12-HWE2-04]|uniref:2-keto-4-pentenoate hydratase n=1 Tax=Sphingomonas sp. MMS12-HWE2-04 TaxID=3234199 RepID=UPI00384F619C